MNETLLFIALAFIALGCVLGTVAHTFRGDMRKPVDDPAWVAGLVGFGFLVAAIVSIWV